MYIYTRYNICISILGIIDVYLNHHGLHECSLCAVELTRWVPGMHNYCLHFIKHVRKICDAQTLCAYELELLFEAWPRDQVVFSKNK